jgi:PST family polysaccharide transporter
VKPFDASGNFHPVATGAGLRRSAIRGAGAAITGQAGSFLLGIGSVVVLARLLTPADFGVVTMVTTFSLLFRSFGVNGFSELIMQREGLTDALTTNLFWIEVGIGLLLTVAFAASGRLLAMLYHNSPVAEVAEGLSLTIGIGCLGWIHLGLLQRAMCFRAAAIINFLGVLVYVIVAIVLAVMGWHYWALVWGSVAQAVVTAAGAWLVCRWVPGWPGRVTGTGSGVKFATSVYAHFAFNYSTRNTDNLLVGWRFGARELGFYKKAYDLFVLPESQLLPPLSAVVVTTLSRVVNDRDQFRRYFLRVVSILALVGMAVGADFALVGREIIRVLLGPGWGQAGRIFALFGPGIGVAMLYNTHGWVHLSIGRPDRWFRWGLMEFGCTLGLFLLTLRWGPEGIALAWTMSYFILFFPGVWYAGRPVGLGIGPICAVIWKFVMASAAAGGAAWLIFRAVPAAAMGAGASGALLRGVSVSALFLALYCAGIAILHKGVRPITDAAALAGELLPDSIRQRLIPGVGQAI